MVSLFKTSVQIAAGVSVDIMPGSNDPANFALPQQVCPFLSFSFFWEFMYILTSN
jgi:DNA polymerase II small subunit/DNA polymerase delta subunit B